MMRACLAVLFLGGAVAMADDAKKDEGLKAPFDQTVKFEQFSVKDKAKVETLAEGVHARVTKEKKWMLRSGATGGCKVAPVKGDRITDADGKTYIVVEADFSTANNGTYFCKTDPAPK